MTPLRLTVGWTILVVVACTIPDLGPPRPPSSFPLDKVAHVLMFAGVGWFWTRARPDRVGAVIGWGLAFGVATELWQGLLPLGRSMEVGDAVADAVGLGLGVAAALAVARVQRNAE